MTGGRYIIVAERKRSHPQYGQEPVIFTHAIRDGSRVVFRAQDEVHAQIMLDELNRRVKCQSTRT